LATEAKTKIELDEAALNRACGSSRWAAGVLAAGPVEDLDALWTVVDAAFDALERDDWLEAFRHHPRIGDVDKLRERFAHSGDLSEREQAGLSGADEAVLSRLHAMNLAYEERFGHVFLICASGKRADEMLVSLDARYDNCPDEELRIAAAEQRKITRLRLEAALSACGAKRAAPFTAAASVTDPLGPASLEAATPVAAARTCAPSSVGGVPTGVEKSRTLL
jgi:2-oxo-4-hydroxy-4-carboxy-5-ureidoimidazoline decarboxylase